MKRIEIAPAPQPPIVYDLLIEAGALARLPTLLEEVAPAHQYHIIADGNVAPLYAEPARAALEAAGYQATLHTFEAGEAAKSRTVWARLTDALVEAGAGRDSVVVALGGGVTGDLAGFVAATYLRGVPLVQVPTSLLAMIDSSVGGKTGIDLPLGKNLVGAFHSPSLVVADPLVLRTLPQEEFRAGLAEAVKHGAIADQGYFDWIAGASPRLFAHDVESLSELVYRSIEIKASFAAADPFEAGPRKALNFGHTIGHALEALSRYQLAHGFAVAIGMMIEAEIGEELGVTERGTRDELSRCLEAVGLPTAIPRSLDAKPAEIIALTRRDKKNRAARTHFTLLAQIGEVARAADGGWSHAPEEADVERVLTVSLDKSVI